jgi:hypothetical protein
MLIETVEKLNAVGEINLSLKGTLVVFEHEAERKQFLDDLEFAKKTGLEMEGYAVERGVDFKGLHTLNDPSLLFPSVRAESSIDTSNRKSILIPLSPSLAEPIWRNPARSTPGSS